MADTTSALLNLLLMGDGSHNSDWGQKTNANWIIVDTAIREICPVAEAREFYGTALPSANWLWANGQAVSRTDYPALYAAIGTTFGAGNGTTTFNVPDRREVAAIGNSTMGGASARGLLATPHGLGGAPFGEEKHVLALGEMPTHNHAVTDPGHAHAVTDPGHAHAVTDPGHAHSINVDRQNNTNLISNGTSFRANSGSDPGGTALSGTGISVNLNGTNVTINLNGTGISLAPAGSNGAHNNMQPSIACNVIIRAK